MNYTGTHTQSNRFASTFAVVFGLLFTMGIVSCGGGGGGGDDEGSLTINSPSVVEGDSGTVELIFTIELADDADSTLTVDYTTADDTATVADGDYTAVSGELTIPEGSRTASVSVFANGDAVFEQNESFNLEISNPEGLDLEDENITGIGSIENDDDADPKGYYAGTATVNGTGYNDAVALVFGNRVLLFSPSANVQYDIAITTDVFDYTGTVEVYVDGNIEQVGAVTITGTTNELEIIGNFAGGSAFGAGGFNVAFDVDNNRGATLPRIEATGGFAWDGNLYGIDVDTGEFQSDNSGDYFGGDDNIQRCSFPNATSATFVIPDIETNVYQMAHPIENQGVGTCAATYESTGHTGFAAVIDDAGTDDKLFFAFNNNDIAMFGIMNRP